jgi:hemerythrin-like metal-binding protein
MTRFDARLKLLGIEEMDDDHRQLVAIANTIDEVASRPRLDEVELAAAIAQLKSKTREHFEREEVYMAAAGFPELEAHRAEHTALLAALDKLVVAATTGQYISQNLRHYMAIWLFEHIDKADMNYAAHVQASGGA